MDVDLTERGITEARSAARLLLDDGQQHDLVCTSCLRRAIRTACLVLSGTDQCWLPVIKDVRLNEQHSGALTGNNKAELAKIHGVEQVMAWRRTYDCPPPALPDDDPFQRVILQDDRYRGSGVIVPKSESLQDTLVRITALWEDTLAPALRSGKNVMVVSHGNSLRALVKLVEGVSDAGSFNLDLPTACPVVYDLGADLKPCSQPLGFWGDSNAARCEHSQHLHPSPPHPNPITSTPSPLHASPPPIRYGRFLYSESKVRAAQELMRQQCVQDIAVSTVHRSGATDDDEVTFCDAWTAQSSDKRIVTLNGQSFNVREKPPSYFALESERIKINAQRELSSMINTFQRSQEAAFKAASADGSQQQAPMATTANANPAIPKVMLIILRHGFSEYNAENRCGRG